MSTTETKQTVAGAPENQASASLLPYWKKPIGLMLLLVYFAISATMIVPSIKALMPVDSEHHNIYGTTVGHDFRVFHTAAKLAGEKRYDELYDARLFEETYNAMQPGSQHFSYPPTAFLYLVPLGKLSYLQAFTVWMAVATLVLIALFYRMTGSLLVLAVTIASPLFLRGIITGQTGMLVTLLFAGGLFALKQKKPVLAGISFGLLAFKPHLALALPLCLIASRDWKTLFSGALTLLFLITMSYLFFGAEAWGAFLTNFGASLTSEYSSDEETIISFTIWSIFLNWSGSEVLALTMALVGAAFAVTVTWYVWKNTEAIAPRALCLILLPTFISPYFHTYDMTPLILVFALMAKDFFYKPACPRKLLVMLAIWVLGLIIFKSVMYANFILPVFFLFLLMALAVMLTKDQAKI